MRHGESYNNLCAAISEEYYRQNRKFEPEMSQIGNECSHKVG